MPSFNSQQTQDKYTNALTIEGVEGSNGGSADIAGANVFYALEGPIKQSWTEDILARPGSLTIYPGTLGIRFKSAAAGMPATVSARIAGHHEPYAQVAGSASAATAPTSQVNGIIASTGAITAGSGFSCVRNAPGDYTITFTSAFATAPTVSAIIIDGGAAGSVPMDIQAPPTTTGFRVLTQSGVDHAWNFVVNATV